MTTGISAGAVVVVVVVAGGLVEPVAEVAAAETVARVGDECGEIGGNLSLRSLGARRRGLDGEPAVLGCVMVADNDVVVGVAEADSFPTGTK